MICGSAKAEKQCVCRVLRFAVGARPCVSASLLICPLALMLCLEASACFLLTDHSPVQRELMLRLPGRQGTQDLDLGDEPASASDARDSWMASRRWSTTTLAHGQLLVASQLSGAAEAAAAAATQPKPTEPPTPTTATPMPDSADGQPPSLNGAKQAVDPLVQPAQETGGTEAEDDVEDEEEEEEPLDDDDEEEEEDDKKKAKHDQEMAGNEGQGSTLAKGLDCLSNTSDAADDIPRVSYGDSPINASTAHTTIILSS